MEGLDEFRLPRPRCPGEGGGGDAGAASLAALDEARLPQPLVGGDHGAPTHPDPGGQDSLGGQQRAGGYVDALHGRLEGGGEALVEGAVAVCQGARLGEEIDQLFDHFQSISDRLAVEA